MVLVVGDCDGVLMIAPPGMKEFCNSARLIESVFDCFIARSLFVLYRLFVFVLSVCEYYMLLMVLQLLLYRFR